MTAPPKRHLHLDSGPLHLDFQGPADQIRDVAADLAATGQFAVQVDDDIHPDQAPLPCGQLWDAQPPRPSPEICCRTDAFPVNSAMTPFGQEVG